jgi:hypothetical protein
MEKLVLNFNGYSDIDKNDVVVEKINAENGNMERVDVSDMTTKEIIEGVKKGEFYINFMETYANTLDGECSLELEEAPENEF